MQIEETFRDAKSHRWGFALRYARSRSVARLEVLVFLTALAQLVFWLLGLAARSLNLARHFQANTERKRHVLSVPFLGRQILLRQQASFADGFIDIMLLQLRHLIAQQVPA